jgi:hypothetical protein
MFSYAFTTVFISNEIHENTKPYSFELYKEFRHNEEIKFMEFTEN